MCQRQPCKSSCLQHNATCVTSCHAALQLRLCVLKSLQANKGSASQISFLLQNETSQADLIVNLANIGMKNLRSLQQMYALYDGTKQSLRTIPNIDSFGSTNTGLPSIAYAHVCMKLTSCLMSRIQHACLRLH